jgi:DNA-binding NtrC family response regulator
MEPSAAADPSHERRRKKILVVEDDFLSRWAVAEYLRETRYEVIEAVNTVEARAILVAGATVDAIFWNVNLDVDPLGHDFGQWLGEKYPALPMLLTSADFGASGLSDDTANQRFIAKPYTPSDIESRLTQILAA